MRFTCPKGADKGRQRVISYLSQPLPKLSEWNNFLTNDFNKLQLTQLLADFILSGESDLGKDALVTKGDKCFYIAADKSSVPQEVPDLHSCHREADPKIAHHAVYTAS